jgi:hypothetical protein
MNTHWNRAMVLVALAIVPFGCQEKETAPTPPSGAATAGAPNSPSATGGGSGPDTSQSGGGTPMMSGAPTEGGAPMMGGGGKPPTLAEAAAQAPKDDKSLAPLAAAYAKAEAGLKKAPKDAGAKKAFVEAAYTYGHAAEYSDTLGPRVKYRSALYLYRKALGVDPQHAPSLKEKEQIEQIYAGMPGGVPNN